MLIVGCYLHDDNYLELFALASTQVTYQIWDTVELVNNYLIKSVHGYLLGYVLF